MSPDPPPFSEATGPVKTRVLRAYGWTLLAASAFPIACVCAGLWLISVIQIPTGEDARKASEFRAGLVQKLEPYRLKDLDKNMKFKPLRGGRGKIVLQGPVSYSKGEIELIRKEFDRLNVDGHYTWDPTVH